MKDNYINPYRRHVSQCPHRKKGNDFSLCGCPLWGWGRVRGETFRKTLDTDDTTRAFSRIAQILADPKTIAEMDQGKSIGQAIDAYLNECLQRNLKPSSIRSYTRTLTQFREFAGPRSVDKLTTELIAAFRDMRKVSPRTQRKELEYLRALCAFCASREWITGNPARRIKPPKIEDVATLPFTDQEIGKMIAACEEMRGMWPSDTPYVQQRARALVLLLLYSGLRVGDVAKLQRSRLLRSGHLVLRTEKNNVPVKIKLHPDVIHELASLPAPGGNPNYYFWSGHGDPDDCSKSLWRTIKRVGDVAGVHAHPHRFRDTFCVELLTQGCDIRTIQKLLGHSSVRTTEKHYAHFVVAHQALLDAATATLDFEPKASRPLLVQPLQNRRRNAE